MYRRVSSIRGDDINTLHPRYSEGCRHGTQGTFLGAQRGHMAEREGFEPPWDLRPQQISSLRRYDRFGTSPSGGDYNTTVRRDT